MTRKFKDTELHGISNDTECPLATGYLYGDTGDWHGDMRHGRANSHYLINISNFIQYWIKDIFKGILKDLTY